MTIDQHEKAIDLRERIQRLKDLIVRLKRGVCNEDVSMSPHTSTVFHITGGMGSHVHSINHAELIFLIKAFESEIDRLEIEFRKL